MPAGAWLLGKSPAGLALRNDELRRYLKIHAIKVTQPAKPVAVIPLEQRPGHRRHLTARSRKPPCQAQPGAARRERCDFFGAEQVRQVSAQPTVQSFTDTIDAVAFLGGQIQGSCAASGWCVAARAS